MKDALEHALTLPPYSAERKRALKCMTPEQRKQYDAHMNLKKVREWRERQKLKPVPMVEILYNKRDMWVSRTNDPDLGTKLLKDGPTYKALAPVLDTLRSPTGGNLFHLTMAEYTAITGREELP